MTESSNAILSLTPREQLKELIKELAVVHGKVTLSSGKEADYYVDLRRVTLHHRAAPLIGHVLLDALEAIERTAQSGGRRRQLQGVVHHGSGQQFSQGRKQVCTSFPGLG